MTDRQVFLPVDQAYDRWSKIYDTYPNPMVFMASCAVAAHAPQVKGKGVFEFGCGTGRNLAAYLEAGAASVAGCDLSEGMLAAALAAHPGLRLYHADMSEPTSEPGESAHLVLFSLALEHVADLGPPLAEARRIVRSVGTVRVIELHPYLSITGLAALFRDSREDVRMPAYPHQLTGYISAFNAAGLRLTGCEEWRPNDVGNPAPLQSAKNGPDFPLAIEFTLERA